MEPSADDSGVTRQQERESGTLLLVLDLAEQDTKFK